MVMLMSSKGSPQSVRNYEAFCLAALLVLVVVLVQMGLGVWCLLPLLMGVAGVTARWRLGPILLILVLAFLLTDPWLVAWMPRESGYLTDFLLCGSVLAYTAAQYRLQGLAHWLVPPDRRLRQPPETGKPRVVPALEIILLLTAVPVWSILAKELWLLLPEDWHELGFLPTFWRTLILAWLLGLVALVGGALLAHWNRRRLTRMEAALFLQDVLWRETRGEQRRITRWLAWDRLRRQRKERT